jgi:hypothetical protein
VFPSGGAKSFGRARKLTWLDIPEVERTYAWLGNYRRLVVRCERLAHIYLAFVMVAFILICLTTLLK